MITAVRTRYPGKYRGEFMTISQIRDKIKSRNYKVREMELNFEPTLRVQQFKEKSLEEIKEAYVCEVAGTISALQLQQNAIKKKYVTALPSLEKKAILVSVRGMELRALSTPQLIDLAKKERALPAGLNDPVEVRLLGAELRNRGKEASQIADGLAVWAESINVDEPFRHDLEYKKLDAKINKYLVFEQQAIAGSMLVCSDDPDAIVKDDIVRFDAIDEVVP
jgi:hypothetical protein